MKKELEKNVWLKISEAETYFYVEIFSENGKNIFHLIVSKDNNVSLEILMEKYEAFYFEPRPSFNFSEDISDLVCFLTFKKGNFSPYLIGTSRRMFLKNPLEDLIKMGFGVSPEEISGLMEEKTAFIKSRIKKQVESREYSAPQLLNRVSYSTQEKKIREYLFGDMLLKEGGIFGLEYHRLIGNYEG